MTFSLATNPQNFFDITSAKLLVAPRPQFIYAKAILAALGKDLMVENALGHIGQPISGVGANYGPLENDALILSNSTLASIFTTPVEQGFVGLPGQTVRFNRPKYDSTTYTLASREIGVNQTISTVPVDVGSEQASMTLKRFAGPYDQANSRVAPYAIDRLTAQVGVHRVASIYGGHFQYDFHRWLDAVGVALLDVGAPIYPGSFTADDEIVATGIGNITYEQLLRLEQEMDDANLPTFGDGFRLLVLPPAAKKQLALDDDYKSASEFHHEMNPLFPTYFGSVGKFHIIISTTLNSVANSSGVQVYRGHAICPGVCGVGSGEPPHTAYSNENNYGETEKVIWLAYLAFATLDSRFVRTVRFGA